MKKNQKGITLVALVITIIVLLILAGVTIASLAGENGLLTRSSKAVNANTTGTKKEQVVLSYDTASGAYYDAKYVDNSVTNIAPNGTITKIEPTAYIVKQLLKDADFTEVAGIYDSDETNAKEYVIKDASGKVNGKDFDGTSQEEVPDNLTSAWIRLKGSVRRDANENEYTGKNGLIQVQIKNQGNASMLAKPWSDEKPLPE